MEKTKPGSFEAVVRKICLNSNRVSGVILALLVLVLVVDVFGRFVGYPVLGSYEIVQYGFGLIVCLSVAHASIDSGHITIDLLADIFPKGIQRISTGVAEMLSALMFALIVWRLGVDGAHSFQIGERSSTLDIPVYYFQFALALGFAMLALVILLHFVKSIGGKE